LKARENILLRCGIRHLGTMRINAKARNAEHFLRVAAGK